jgi:hypothetical protein
MNPPWHTLLLGHMPNDPKAHSRDGIVFGYLPYDTRHKREIAQGTRKGKDVCYRDSKNVHQEQRRSEVYATQDKESMYQNQERSRIYATQGWRAYIRIRNDQRSKLVNDPVHMKRRRSENQKGGAFSPLEMFPSWKCFQDQRRDPYDPGAELRFLFIVYCLFQVD